MRLEFDDGHETGIYSRVLLHDYGMRKDHIYPDYLRRLNLKSEGRYFYDNKLADVSTPPVAIWVSCFLIGRISITLSPKSIKPEGISLS